MSHGNHQQRLNESLSALMDGEASELEIQRLLKESDASGGDLGQRWSRYQLAASVMRAEAVAPVSSGLAASISAAIADEPPLAVAAEPQAANDSVTTRSRWWRPLSRGAVAATVAFAAVLGVQQIQAPQTGGGDVQVAAVERPAQQPVQSAPQPSGFLVPTLNTRAVSTNPQLVPEQRIGAMGPSQVQVAPSPELMRHLNRVMMEHSEQAARVGSQGMVPFARATYGDRPPE